ITYPKPPEIESGDTTFLLQALKGTYNGAYNNNYKKWDVLNPVNYTGVTVINNWRVKVNETGSYRLKFYGLGTMDYRVRTSPFGMGTLTTLFRINLFVNGELKSYVLSDTDFNTAYFDTNIQSDQEIELTITPVESTDINIENNYIRDAI